MKEEKIDLEELKAIISNLIIEYETKYMHLDVTGDIVDNFIASQSGNDIKVSKNVNLIATLS